MLSVWSKRSPTGRVNISESCMRMAATTYSFHAAAKENKAVTTRPCPEIGTTTRQKISAGVQPSMAAASSIVSGMRS